MTIARVHTAPGWVFTEMLTSAQLNTLDIDHVNSTDKTVAGDTLTGTIAMGGSSLIDLNTVGTKVRVSLSGAKIAASAAGASIEAQVAGSFIGATAAGALIKASGGGAFQAADDAVSNGQAKYTFATPQSRTVRYSTAKHPSARLPAGWSYDFAAINVPQLKGSATTVEAWLSFTPHNGAILESLAMYVQVNGAHVNLPANLPYVSIMRVRRNPTVTTAAKPWTLNYLLFASDDIGTPALAGNPPTNFPRGSTMTASDWNAGGKIQVWTNVMSATPVAAIPGVDPRIIDTSQYSYFVRLIDENGGGIAGNTYPWFDITYSGISDMRFST